MNAVLAAFMSCIATGAVFTSLCAALIVPFLSWIAIRSLSPVIQRMHGDWHAQAALAAWAACTPGALFLFLVAYGLATGASSPCLQTVAGRMLFGALAALMLAAIARATVLALQRRGAARRLCATAIAPSPRLARIAAFAGVSAHELSDDRHPIVMLYGQSNPAVYVSAKALCDLGDAELLAALHHERAHQKRGDHRIAPAVYFLADLLPFSVARFVATYRRAREFCADQCALEHVCAPDLAAALLQVVSPQKAAVAHAAAFAETAALRERLQALLAADTPRPNAFRRVAATASLSAITAAGLFTPAIASLIVHCSSMGLWS